MKHEDWIKPLNDLNKNHKYLVGFFNSEEKRVTIFYKDDKFYFEAVSKSSTQYADYYKFKSLSRAYEYFEQMFYGRWKM